MAGEEELLAVDDKEMFAAALGAEPPAEQPEQQPSEEPKPEGEQPRDEHGRFAPKAAEAEQPVSSEEAASTEDPEAKSQSPQDAVPSWRLREVSDARRRAEEENRALQARVQQFEQLFQQVQRQQQPPEQPPDIIENPQGYAQYVRQQVLQEVRQLELAREQREIKRSLERADKTYGEEFKKAYEAFNAPHLRDDERLLEHVRNSYDAGEAILDWFRNTDPKAQRDKLTAELLNDPEFIKKFGDTLRSKATASRQPSNVTSLPNLTRTPGSAGSSADDWPTTDAGIFDTVTRGMSRR